MTSAAVDSRTTGENARRILTRDSDPFVFRALHLRSVTAKNRITLSPMCQYFGEDGCPNDWHFIHLGARASGGSGIVFTEVVHTEARGRITPFCLGLWNDTQEHLFKKIADFVAQQGAIPAMQIGHAGRKASVARPWEGSKPISISQGGWETIGPSPQAYADGWPAPKELSIADIEQLIETFVQAARRALRAGFKIIELHAAHGYLIHQFLSPLSNHRTDRYGGSFENRCRLLRDVISQVRTVWPEELGLFVRVSASDWVEGGWSLDDTIALAAELKASGRIDLIDCSSGGNDPRQQIPIHPGYQVPFSSAVREKAEIATGAVGLIHSPELAESILANGQADLIFLGRALLADPNWPMRASVQLKAKSFQWPLQYERGSIYFG